MEIKQAGPKAFFWIANSQLAQVAAGLVVLPFMLRKLTTEEIGLWYVFFNFYYLFQLLDFGFSPTYVRKLNHLLAIKDLPEEKMDQISNTVNKAKTYYKNITLILSPILFLIGTFYTWFSFKQQMGPISLMTWILFFVSLVFNFYFNYQSIILQGFGKIEITGIAQTISRTTTIVLSVVGLELGLGIISLGISYLVGVFVLRAILNQSIKSTFKHFNIQTISNSKNSVESFFQSIDKEAVKLGLSSFSSFLINRSGIFFVSSYVGLSANASYTISLQFFQLISSISMIPFQVNIPYFNYTRKKTEPMFYTKFYNTLSICLLLYCTGTIVFFAIGEPMLKKVGFNFILLPPLELSLIGIIVGLELNHVIHATFLTTKGIVPFAKAATISAASIIISSYVFTPKYGIVAILLSRGLIQLIYNNWKWPFLVYKDMRLEQE